MSSPIDLSPTGGVHLPPESPEREAAFDKALNDDDPFGAADSLLQRWPDFCAAWALRGDLAFDDGDEVMAYACYRVGYHRSLDRLRGNGWRGAGRVPYDHVPNRAFHQATAGLMRVSASWGDVDEAERCRRLLLDADPSDPLGIAGLSIEELALPPADA